MGDQLERCSASLFERVAEHHLTGLCLRFTRTRGAISALRSVAVFDGDILEAIHTTDDGFTLAEGSERVSPAEFESRAPGGLLLLPVIVQALAVAASDDGALLDFDVRGFFDEHIIKAIELSPDDPRPVYDSFTSMTLREAFTWLEARGFLAHRGNGDSYDYWLAAPAVSRG